MNAAQEGQPAKAKTKATPKNGLAGLAGKLAATRNARRAEGKAGEGAGGTQADAVGATADNRSKRPVSGLDAVKAILALEKGRAVEKPDLEAVKKIGKAPAEVALDPAKALAVALDSGSARRLEGRRGSAKEGTEEAKVEAKHGPSSAREGLAAAPATPTLESRIVLTDLRTPAKAKAEEGGVASVEAKTQGAKAPARELSLDLDATKGLQAVGRDPGLAQAPDPAGMKAETAPARDFSSVLAEQLKAQGNTDIVQGAQLILRDGDSGTIRLRLHPDSLGGVKIELRVTDNSISGKIVVESDAAKSAFERNMASLNDAFKQGGFESSRLEVQVGSGNQGQGGQQGQDGPLPFWSERRGRESLAQSVPDLPAEGRSGRALGAVNLFA